VVKGFGVVIAGVAVFIVVTQLITTSITGTSTGDILLQSILSIGLAAAILVSVIRIMS